MRCFAKSGSAALTCNASATGLRRARSSLALMVVDAAVADRVVIASVMETSEVIFSKSRVREPEPVDPEDPRIFEEAEAARAPA